MSISEYEYECSRAELLGAPKPSWEEFAEKYKSAQQSEVEETVSDFNEGQPDDAQELASQGEKIGRVGGGLEELNSILASTQIKINKFKTVCGSFTNLIKIRGWKSEAGSKGGSDSEETSSSLPATPQKRTVSGGNYSGDMEATVASQVDRLDSLINKSERAEISMNAQNKQCAVKSLVNLEESTSQFSQFTDISVSGDIFDLLSFNQDEEDVFWCALCDLVDEATLRAALRIIDRNGVSAFTSYDGQTAYTVYQVHSFVRMADQPGADIPKAHEGPQLEEPGEDRPKAHEGPQLEEPGEDRPKAHKSPRLEKLGEDRPKAHKRPRLEKLGEDRPKDHKKPRLDKSGEERPKAHKRPRLEKLGEKRPKKRCLKSPRLDKPEGEKQEQAKKVRFSCLRNVVRIPRKLKRGGPIYGIRKEKKTLRFNSSCMVRCITPTMDDLNMDADEEPGQSIAVENNNELPMPLLTPEYPLPTPSSQDLSDSTAPLLEAESFNGSQHVEFIQPLKG